MPVYDPNDRNGLTQDPPPLDPPAPPDLVNRGTPGDYRTPDLSLHNAYGGYASAEDQNIAAAYQDLMGRTLAPGSDEFRHWRGVPTYLDGIYRSPEAQAYRARLTAPQTGTVPQRWDANWFASTFGRPSTPQELLALEQRIQQAGGKVLRNAAGTAGKIQDPSGQIVDVILAAGAGGRGFQWLTGEGEGGGGGAYGGGMPGAAGSAFSDPATSQWEQLIRSLVDRLNTPVPQGQLELQQTQALDPLERQRQQQRQQMAQRLSQRGHTPGSGIFEQAMQDVDRQFNELRTRTQAGFANAAAQDQERRMGSAVDLFQRIPNYQDQRLQLAMQSLIPANPAQLLNTQMGFDQLAQSNARFNQQQQQAWLFSLAQLIDNAFNR